MGGLPDKELALLVLEPEHLVLLFLTCSGLDWGAWAGDVEDICNEVSAEVSMFPSSTAITSFIVGMVLELLAKCQTTKIDYGVM